MRLAGRYMVLMAGLGLSVAADADTFRCAGHIIEAGMSQQEVLQYCGEPDARDEQNAIVWTYIRSAEQMNVLVRFYANGKIEEIDSQPH